MKRLIITSLVLTKAAFFHVDWLDAYWSPDDRMRHLRAYVEESKLWSTSHIAYYSDYATDRNCEDILMSFLQTYHTRKPPLFVEAGAFDAGFGNGISSSGSHLDARTQCIRQFMEYFGEDTLISTTLKLSHT